MKAQVPPRRCASATTCSASVVFPDDSGPYTSTMRPRGSPPVPRAMSSPIDPVEMTGTSTVASPVPRRISVPLPNCFSMSARVAVSARERSVSAGACFVFSVEVGVAVWVDVGWVVIGGAPFRWAQTTPHL